MVSQELPPWSRIARTSWYKRFRGRGAGSPFGRYAACAFAHAGAAASPAAPPPATQTLRAGKKILRTKDSETVRKSVAKAWPPSSGRARTLALESMLWKPRKWICPCRRASLSGPRGHFEEVCLIDAMRALGVKVSYPGDGPFWALKDGNHFLAPHGCLGITAPRSGLLS